ncbi:MULTISPECIES: hypothetical protein [Pseudomonas]|nr:MULTISPECIES: hypothetical protein [Pseudomonas]KPX10284.1 hypothetical protein ALO74_05361 [Pseudomonas syringae pv. cunninghamiae]KPB19979.1 hypothetical protein AC519_3715 [Pseudomonas savastanoi]KPB23458.1 Uncharacterized protein AC516_4706 [Pseudomonas amygdali pv. sesami]KPB60037.1 Uncharacterized protein AC510_0795 [Pseudomonas amygdali pv. myricae]KPW74174.1 hypothetical protein ALO78_02701 [Pseudomonas amygdali pv. ciccaronei]
MSFEVQGQRMAWAAKPGIDTGVEGVRWVQSANNDAAWVNY